MSDNQRSHITVSYKDDAGIKRIYTYAVSEEISREADRKRNWWGRKLTGVKLQNWLEKKGCELDNWDGPAMIIRPDSRTMLETYYRNGKKHREGGPAHVKHNADGTTEEEYYCDGKQHREDGPAYVKRLGNVSIEEYYCLDGVMCGKIELEIRQKALHKFAGSYYGNEAENNQSRQVHGVSPSRCEQMAQDDGGLKRDRPDPIRDTGKPTTALNQKKLPAIKM